MKFLALVGIVALIWLVGLFAFADRVRGFTPAPEPERADGIVALTGPSAERVNAAIRLLEQDKGERVLISGVNREVRRQELRELTPGSNRLFNCCVDLGFEAEDTVGNAQEIAAWTRAKGYRSLIVVTSDYHMPRSLLEIRGAAPGVKLIPYAALGQLNPDNLRVAAMLCLPAIFGVWLGLRLLRIIPQALFYSIITWGLLLVSVKLVWDGVSGLLG